MNSDTQVTQRLAVMIAAVLPVSRVEDSSLLDRFEREMWPAKLEHDGKTYFVVRPIEEGEL